MHVRANTHILDKAFVESIDASAVEVIKPVNKMLFGEDRLINDFQHKDLIILVAYVGEAVAGFKIGYGAGQGMYYSAKSGVLPAFRRRGLATKLLNRMILEVKIRGYGKMAFDTFPARFPGMMALGLKEGFKPVSAKWSPAYKDYQVRLEVKL